MQILAPWALSLLLALGAAGCSSESGPEPTYLAWPCQEAAGAHSPLATRCQHFVDAEGRVVFLRGVNARVDGVFDVDLGPMRVPLETIPAFGAADAARMRELGFNILRLPIQWSGVEPTDESPPAYDQAYLDEVEAIVDHCRAAGVLVLLDFHQDAYSKEIGEDGAPLWAIQPPPTMLLEGPLDDLAARRASAQVLAAFRTFFGDAEPGPTLRTRFASMAAHVTSRFIGDDAVVGVEVFNEPFASHEQILRLNTEVAEAIRAADPARLVFFEPEALGRNFTDESPIPEQPFPVEGAVYSPHVYTFAFDLPVAWDPGVHDIESLRAGNVSAALEARAWGTPLFVGEWGFNPALPSATDYYGWQLDLQDEMGASSAVWVWKEESQGRWGLHDHDDMTGVWTERPELRAVLARPRVERVAGWPETMRYDSATEELTLTFTGSDDVSAPTLLYVPDAVDWKASFVVTCDGAEISVTRDAATGLVEAPCPGPGVHEIVLR